MRVRRVATLAAVVVTALAALTGCSDDAPQGTVLGNGDRESTNDTSSPSPTATDTPTPTESANGKVTVTDGPGEVEGTVEDQAKAFIRKFLKEQNKATGNGDFSTVDTMIERCSVCEDSQAYITGAYESGGKVEGGIYTESKITVEGKEGDDVFVRVDTVISAYKTTDGSGKVIDQGPAESQTYQYTVRKIDGQWQLVGGRFVG